MSDLYKCDINYDGRIVLQLANGLTMYFVNTEKMRNFIIDKRKKEIEEHKMLVSEALNLIESSRL